MSHGRDGRLVPKESFASADQGECVMPRRSKEDEFGIRAPEITFFRSENYDGALAPWHSQCHTSGVALLTELAKDDACDTRSKRGRSNTPERPAWRGGSKHGTKASYIPREPPIPEDAQTRDANVVGLSWQLLQTHSLLQHSDK